MITRVALIVLFLLPLTTHAEPASAVRRSHEDFTVAQLQAEMAAGRLTSEALTREYLGRILALDQDGPGVNSVMELNPDALAWARHADRLRRQGRLRGPLHGIPVLLKDNIDTGDRMQTTAGSFRPEGRARRRSDSTVAARLRAGGAVILGKTNLSEWANFRSFFSSSGWSAAAG